MRARWLLIGLVCGVAVGSRGPDKVRATTSAVADDEPSIVLKNGVLEGWEITRDDETLVCTDPTVFIRAKQIECP